jgi:hypothetical protein
MYGYFTIMNVLYEIWLSIGPWHAGVIATTLLMAGATVVCFATLFQRRKPDPLLEFVENSLLKNPLDPTLLLYSAEVNLRKRRPLSCITNLERAFELGMPPAELEPTFWAFYSLARAGTRVVGQDDHWFNFYKRKAPKLFALFVENDQALGAQRVVLRLQEGSETVKADVAARDKIFQSVKLLLPKPQKLS